METPRKHLKTKSKSKRCVCRKKAEVAVENLLLNYTYYLDECHSRKVVLGFDKCTFEAKIVFHLNGCFPVSTTYTGWMSVYSFLNNLKKKIFEEPFALNQEDEMKKQYKIPIEKGSVTLKQTELYKLFDMMEYFNLVMFHNNNATESVKEFYKKYCEKCKERNVLKLTGEDFFIPSRASYVHINYTRLFYEIPFYCPLDLVF